MEAVEKASKLEEGSNIVMSLVGSGLSINIVWINRCVTGKRAFNIYKNGLLGGTQARKHLTL